MREGVTDTVPFEETLVLIKTCKGCPLTQQVHGYNSLKGAAPNGARLPLERDCNREHGIHTLLSSHWSQWHKEINKVLGNGRQCIGG